jgi:hypothetical protein
MSLSFIILLSLILAKSGLSMAGMQSLALQPFALTNAAQCYKVAQGQTRWSGYFH